MKTLDKEVFVWVLVKEVIERRAESGKPNKRTKSLIDPVLFGLFSLDIFTRQKQENNGKLKVYQGNKIYNIYYS